MASAISFSIIQGLFPQDDVLGWIFQIAWVVFFVIFMFYGQRLQTSVWLREIEGSLVKLKLMKEKGRELAISTIKDLGKSVDDPTSRVDRFLEYVHISPVDLDPSGIIRRWEHIMDVRDARFKDEVHLMVPEADKTIVNNMSNVLEAALALNQIYKIIRHFYLMSKKTHSMYYIMQIQMALPMIMKESEAFSNAIMAFRFGHPIGDGIGALVAAKLLGNQEKREIAKDTVVGKTEIEGRTAFVLKAVGPGGNVGKPGEAIRQIVKENEGTISMIVLVDAGLKLEGENLGEVVEGIGVAIGGVGVEKYKVEDIATKKGVPINAIIIKEDFSDAITTMRKEVFDAAEEAINRINRLIRERTKKGEKIIIAGIGNTMGIGQ